MRAPILVLVAMLTCPATVVGVETVDERTDLVTVSAPNGHAYSFYADCGEYAWSEPVNVVFDRCGRIVAARKG